MSRKLTGISALLRKQVERLEREIELFANTGVSDLGGFQHQCADQLAQLRNELNRELETKRVVVLGTVHELQKSGHKKNAELESRLRFLIEKFAVTKLLEEWAGNQAPSFASEFAKDLLAYKDVGTPPETMFQTFCCAQTNHPCHDGTLSPCDGAPAMNEYGPLEKQENREQRMIQTIQREMEGHDVGLFVVGLAHLHSMSLKLKQANFNVTAYAWLG